MTCSFCGKEETLAIFKAREKIAIHHGETSNGIHASISVETHPGICEQCILGALDSLVDQIREYAKINKQEGFLVEFLAVARSYLTKRKKKN